MRTFITTSAVIMASIVAAGCHSGLDCVEGSGEVRSETRDVTEFHTVVIEGSMDVILTQAATQSLHVEAENNLLPLITTTVADGVLTVDSKGCLSTHKPIRIHASLREVRGATISGSGDITATTPITSNALGLRIEGSGSITLQVEAGTMTISIGGSGDVKLAGSAGSSTVTINGSGDVRAEALPVQDCAVRVNGSGDCYVNVTRRLDVVIEGSGDVYYRGNPPTVKTTIEGSGTVSKLP